MDSLDNAHEIARVFTSGAPVSCESVTRGSINKTYFVTREGDHEVMFVLQRMHTLFTPLLMEDIERVTDVLASKGILTQRVIRTPNNERFVREGGAWWRALTYLPGTSVDAVSSATDITSAGVLLGAFHRALADFQESFSFTLAHYRDTRHYLKRMLDTVKSRPSGAEFKAEAAYIERELALILAAERALPVRVIHGDLKISNVLFDESGRAVALIDLDTVMRHSIIADVGDAVRSWCALGDEDTENLAFSRERFQSVLDGYTAAAPFLTPKEHVALSWGAPLITLELAARFITDALEERYFVHRTDLYPSLHEQNRNRALNQLSLYKSMKEQGISE